MNEKYRIGILGIGAVGGYFGCKLAAKYHNSKTVDIIFIARGENAKAIKQNGLKIITPSGDLIAYPSLLSADPVEIGKLDFVLCTLKAYDLVTGIKQYSDCIHPGTIFLPLLNGVSASEETRKIFPRNEVWEGFAYIVVRLISPGIVKETGIVHSIYFGSQSDAGDKLQLIEKIFSEAGIDCFLSKNIIKEKWEKFLFISSMATATSFLNKSIGEILSEQELRQLWQKLLHEVETVALAKKIPLSPDIIERSQVRAQALPFETTSSMHNDFKNNKRTEVEALTSYVVQQGKLLGIATPTYEMMLAKLEHLEL